MYKLKRERKVALQGKGGIINSSFLLKGEIDERNMPLGDKIRRMSNEELASFLTGQTSGYDYLKKLEEPEKSSMKENADYGKHI